MEGMHEVGEGGGERIAHSGGIQSKSLHPLEVSRSHRVVMVSSPFPYPSPARAKFELTRHVVHHMTSTIHPDDIRL